MIYPPVLRGRCTKAFREGTRGVWQAPEYVRSYVKTTLALPALASGCSASSSARDRSTVGRQLNSKADEGGLKFALRGC
jgi:hypothetical protein